MTTIAPQARQLTRTEAERLAATLKALADPARLRILSMLARTPTGELCVCHLTRPLGLSQPTVSHHMKQLRRVGLVRSVRRGRWVYYRLVPERLESIRAALALEPDPTR